MGNASVTVCVRGSVNGKWICGEILPTYLHKNVKTESLKFQVTPNKDTLPMSVDATELKQCGMTFKGENQFEEKIQL